MSSHDHFPACKQGVAMLLMILDVACSVRGHADADEAQEMPAHLLEGLPSAHGLMTACSGAGRLPSQLAPAQHLGDGCWLQVHHSSWVTLAADSQTLGSALPDSAPVSCRAPAVHRNSAPQRPGADAGHSTRLGITCVRQPREGKAARSPAAARPGQQQQRWRPAPEGRARR